MDSTLGKGTRIDIWLPAVSRGSKLRISDAGELPRGNERILLVDDEMPVVQVSKSILKRLGYTVTAVNSSTAALKTCVLIIDDEAQFRNLFINKLTKLPCDVIEAENGSQGISLFLEYRPDIVVIDLVMSENEGLETIIDLKKIDSAVKIIAVSGGGRNVPDLYLEFARKMGVKRFFEKPLDWEEMLAAIQEGFGK